MCTCDTTEYILLVIVSVKAKISISTFYLKLMIICGEQVVNTNVGYYFKYIKCEGIVKRNSYMPTHFNNKYD